MSSNTDIMALLSTEADKAVDQIVEDSKRLNIVVNGDGTAQTTTEDGSLIASVRKALLDNLFFTGTADINQGHYDSPKFKNISEFNV